jgi:hypothetical protein
MPCLAWQSPYMSILRGTLVGYRANVIIGNITFLTSKPGDE